MIPMKTPKNFRLTPLATALSLALTTQSVLAEENATTQTLESISVTGDFRTQELKETATSVSVISELEQQRQGSRHLENLLGQTPNLHAASGGSRANFYQIRGIGERSQFETPLNPSVGLNIDGVDYSRTGSAGTLFDTKQVEVLRGPQGTRYGANAMAGMIVVQSNEPTEETQAHIEAGVGSHNTRSAGIAVGGSLIENTLLGRLSIHQLSSDGYMRNTFLDRDDTQNQDEFSAKAQLRWLASDDLTLDLKLSHLDINNGYDAFNFNNDFTTQSDEPGRDTLESDAILLKATHQLNANVIMETTLTASQSDSEYSYDLDWTYDGYHPYGYNAFDQYLRERDNHSFEVRLLSSESGRIFDKTTDWTLGVYYLNQEEGLVRHETYLPQTFVSQYDTVNSALYGQLDHHLSSKTLLTTGLRLERFESDYHDNNNINSDNQENLVGGKLAIQHQYNQDMLAYASVSRGYKAGGVNANPELPTSQLTFDTEYLWNIETGINADFFNKKLQTRLALFYAKRFDQQVNSSLLVDRTDGSTDFIGYLSNAATGKHYGLEAELGYRASRKLQLMASLGLLNAEFSDYSYIDPNDNSKTVTLDGRDQAHSPAYQYQIGMNYDWTNDFTTGVNLQGVGSFYFSNRHDAKQDAYQLVNAFAEWLKDDWTFTLWGRNLTNETYALRGFGSFGNNPANGYITETYIQPGESRTIGLNISWDY